MWKWVVLSSFKGLKVILGYQRHFETIMYGQVMNENGKMYVFNNEVISKRSVGKNWFTDIKN
jgi:hypothetical protein